MNPSSSEPVEKLSQEWLAILDLKGSRRRTLEKSVTSVGTRAENDLQIESTEEGLLFTLAQTENGLRVYPGDRKLRLNGLTLKSEGPMKNMDLLEWKDGRALLMQENRWQRDENSNLESLRLLSRFLSTLRERGSIENGLQLVLESVLKLSGAESAIIATENSEGSGWKAIARRGLKEGDHLSSRELLSQTILSEALKRREAVVVESLIGHPWGAAPSIAASRFFSVACVPLFVSDRPFGALFLFCRSPGRSIRKDCMDELLLLTSLAALMVGTQSELLRAQKESLRLKGLSVTNTSLSWGSSKIMAQLKQRIETFASTPISLLLLGPTGSGKEQLAREVHRLSPRATKPFVAINCAAIPAALLESTLFGHKKGAFTGATASQPGRFQMAEGGTLLLDEIGDLPLDLQSKLLRVLQEKCVEPVGALRPEAIDVRILSATHKNLVEEVNKGRFRQDLYFRLKGAELVLPALKERKEDIPELSRFFLARSHVDMSISQAGFEALTSHSWPGNVRELEFTITKAVHLAKNFVIGPEELELGNDPFASMDEGSDGLSLRDAQRSFTFDYVHRYLERHQGDRSFVATQLGISERTLYRILAEGTSADSGTLA